MLHSEVFFISTCAKLVITSQSICVSIAKHFSWKAVCSFRPNRIKDSPTDRQCEITIVQKGHFLLLLFHIKSNQVGNDMDELAVKQHTGNTVLCIVKVVGLESVKMKSSQSKNRHVRVNISIICKHGIFSMAGQMTPCAQSRQLHCIDWWFSGSRFSPGK